LNSKKDEQHKESQELDTRFPWKAIAVAQIKTAIYLPQPNFYCEPSVTRRLQTIASGRKQYTSRAIDQISGSVKIRLALQNEIGSIWEPK
jgi:hypothetical protein